MVQKLTLNIIYTNIGRGHPHYLDGIVEKLQSSHAGEINLKITDVFAVSAGISRRLWEMVRFFYRVGSQGGLAGSVYGRVRGRQNNVHYGRMKKFLARDVRQYIRSNRYPTLVSHPILVDMIADLVPVFYQHGEIAVPDEAVVGGAKLIFLPVTECKRIFVRKGIPESDLVVSGLCIENDLVKIAGESFEQRITRLQSGESLTGGFFSSGAEPKEHIKKILMIVASLHKSGRRGIVFCRENGKLKKALLDRFDISFFGVGDDSRELRKILAKDKIAAAVFTDRRKENILTANYFDCLDYLVAPSHERTNWAVGLGIPMFILHPIIGTFSPLNRAFMLQKAVAVDIENDAKAADFQALLEGLIRSGHLADMAQRGMGKCDVRGFEVISEKLARALS